MRRVLILIPVVLALAACAKSEVPKADSMVMAEPPAPMMLTEADVAGTWTGVTMMAESDSVVARWTNICGGGRCTGTIEGSKDTIVATYRIEGDSVIGASSPFKGPMTKQMMAQTWVGRIVNGQITGHAETRLADKDSVVSRERFQGTRSP